MTFEQFHFHPSIVKAINACQFKTPTPVQTQSIPYILEGEDIIACAPTGTGKTAAFVLPALNKLCGEKPSHKPRILILTPTRELANQIAQAATAFGKFTQFKMVSIVGGMPYPAQIKSLKRGTDIIVATPGRLLDHIQAKRIDLSSIEILVLDEADRMLDMGFIEDVQKIARMTSPHRQTLLFSATFDKRLENSVKHLLKNPVKLSLAEKKVQAPQIEQALYKVKNIHHKNKLLNQILREQQIFKALIFSGTKAHAGKLAEQLQADGFPAEALHGDMRQGARNRVIEKFRRGKVQFLVATDVASRGIDIGDITHVINFDMPQSNEDYVHRIGRTGRAGKSGIAISFVVPNEVRQLKHLGEFIGQKIQLLGSDFDHEFPMDDEATPPKKRRRRGKPQKSGFKPGRPSKDAGGTGAAGTKRKRKPFRSDAGTASGKKSFKSDASGRKKPGRSDTGSSKKPRRRKPRS